MENHNQNFISVRDMFHACASRWKWFVISVIICMAAAALYIKTTPPTYLRTMGVILLNSGKENHNYSEVNLQSIGLQMPNTSMQDEIEMLRSSVLMQKVVDSLHLEVEYFYPGISFDKVLYGAEVPINVLFSDRSANGKVFTVRCLDSLNILISGFNKPGEEDTEIKGLLNKRVKTPCGEITVIPTPAYNPDSKFTQTVKVSKHQSTVASARFLSRLKVENKDGKSSVVTVSVTDQSISRADDILRVLIYLYDENWKQTQNRITENTSRFLAERVREVGAELGEVDESISIYKGESLMPDAAGAGSMYMSQNNSIQNSLAGYHTRLSHLHYIRSYILDNIDSNNPLPAGLADSDNSLSGRISAYNAMQSQRNEMVAYAGDEHPKVLDMNRQLDILRKNIIESIDQLIVTTQAQIDDQNRLAGTTAARIKGSANNEKVMLSRTRDQKVKEALYLFLLQEKEKTDMTINHSISNVKVIQEAGGSLAPIAPLGMQIFLLAIAIGAGVPFITIFLIEIADTKVRSRKDLEGLTAPFLGEVPLDDSTSAGLLPKAFGKLRRHRHSNHISIVVESQSRNIINESFRMVRTNLEFMLQKDADCRVMVITSSNPGCGKSFIAANLAVSMALVKKKVLLIDLDMRRRTLSDLVKIHNNRGISGYLGHYTDSIDDIICRDAIGESIDLIPVGLMPPNPTELLSDARLGELFGMVRGIYDYIIVDCPPIDIVADVDIINRFSDLTIFVIRAGMVEREWISAIEKMYSGKRFNRLCTLLNGTLAGNAYSRHRYGGYYGHYHYGYYGSYGKSSGEVQA